MKPGDLVQLSQPWGDPMVGVIIEQVFDRLAQLNKVYRVLWQDGTIGNNIWDYDLKMVISENR